MKNQNNYYLGLDIGTDSVGYAVTDEEYNLLKFHGKEAWGSHIFDSAGLNSERRSFRTARRRLDRRQQRVALIQELFAAEIGKKDINFYRRIKESYLYREDCDEKYNLFNDDNYTDVDYFNQYPTIHHLIVDLMSSTEPRDVRLVYLACSWLVAHRGHFLSNINKDNLAGIKDFNAVHENFISYFKDNGFSVPWENVDISAFGAELRRKAGVNSKYKELVSILSPGKKPAKLKPGEPVDEYFPFGLEGIIKLLAGGTYSLKDLFGKEEYDSLEIKSVSLGMDDEKLAQVMADLGEDYDLISALRALYDWAVLADALGNNSTISEAKVAVYEQHKKDLAFLKYIIKKYLPEKYNDVFRATDKVNYASYVYHSDEPDTSKLKKVKTPEDFSKAVISVLKGVTPDTEDAAAFSDMISRLELRTFLTKQKNTDNRVIPHQLYWFELHTLLSKALNYLPFLSEKDGSGLTPAQKIESVFLFRIYDAEQDKITAEKNAELYDLYISKYRNSVYSKRINSPLDTLIKGRDKFVSLDIKGQAKALLNIHQTFGRIAGGIDLTLIGGVSHAAATISFSSNVSNWGKSYNKVYIVDSSSSGLWEKKSGNLLDLL